MASCLSTATLAALLFGPGSATEPPAPAAPPAPPAPLVPPVEQDPLRLAGLVSRDCETFVWTADRAAYLRRLRATPFLKAIAEVDDDDAMDALSSIASELSQVFPAALLSGWRNLLERGAGDVALAVDGFTIGQNGAEPDVLLLADVRGLEKVVAALMRCAQSRDVGEEMLDILEVPFELDESPAVVSVFRGVTIVVIGIEEVGPVAFAESSGVLLASKDKKLVERAIERQLDTSVGSLRDSSRFRAVWERIEPNPGSLVWYANLRKLRQSDFARAATPGSLRAQVGEALRAFDGVGFALRGRGEALELRAFLERGAGRTQDPNPLFRSTERFRSLAAFPAESTCVLAMRVSGEQAAETVGTVARFIGGPGLDMHVKMIGQLLRARGAMPGLLEHLDGELVLCQTKPAVQGEGIPRVAFALECLDEAAVRAWFAEAVRRAGPLPIQPAKIGGLDGYSILFASPDVLLRPVFVVKDGFLFGATQAFVMRDLFRVEGKPAVSLLERNEFLQAFDGIDHDPRQPANALLWLDGSRFMSSALTWTTCAARSMMRRPDRERIDGVERILELLTDPDVDEALSGTAVGVTQGEDGALIVAGGP